MRDLRLIYVPMGAFTRGVKVQLVCSPQSSSVIPNVKQK